MSNKINRNNTNFPLRIHELLSKVEQIKVENNDIKTTEELLRYYQNLVDNYFIKLNVDSKGLLIYHGMGLGKTMVAVAIAEHLKQKYQPIILTTKSLQSNFKKEILNFRELLKLTDEDISRYSFITLNASNMLKQLKRTLEVDNEEEYLDAFLDSKLKNIVDIQNLNGKLIIVDEAHNLFRRITNGSKIGIEFYNIIMRSRNVKLLFLTGTPIAADSFEIVPCFNMLSGEELLPTLYRDFNELYTQSVVGEDDKITSGFIRNKNYLQNRIYGLVSYSVYEQRDDQKVSDFPERFPTIIEKIPMDNFQYAKYLSLREEEKQEGQFQGNKQFNIPALSKPSEGNTTTYRVKTRMCSNYYPPNYFNRKTDDIEKIKDDDVFSPKIKKIFDNVNDKVGIDLAYSQFVDVGGIGIIERYFLINGWEPFLLDKDYKVEPLDLENLTEEKKKSRRSKRFVKIVGSVEFEDREKIRTIINSKENMYGELVSFLLVSATGAEGLDLKNIRRMHMVEPYWNAAREDQFFARGDRYKSHVALPIEDRNTQPYIYLSDHADDATLEQKTEDTTDIYLYKKSQINKKAIESFLDAMKEVSIECSIRKQVKCRICSPTDQKLYTTDFVRDTLASDPCTKYKEETVQAKSVKINDEEYYYIENKQSIFGYNIFEYNDELGGYTQLSEDVPIFESIVKSIKKQK